MNTKDFVNQQFIKSVNILISLGKVKNKSDLSKILGISNSTLSDILSKRQNVGIDIVLKLCDFFGISVEYQLQGKGGMYSLDVDSMKLTPLVGDIKPIHSSIFSNEDISLMGDSNESEVLINSNGNKFYIYPNGRIEIEVLKVPFKAYASYIECYQDEMNTINGFESARFAADHIGRGNYICFISEGDSMNGGMLDDTPGGSEILAREVGRQLWDNLHNTKYGLIFVTKTGIMHKDFGGYNEATGMFTLTSRNKAHKPFEYPANDVYQIFNVIKRSF